MRTLYSLPFARSRRGELSTHPYPSVCKKQDGGNWLFSALRSVQKVSIRLSVRVCKKETQRTLYSLPIADGRRKTVHSSLCTSRNWTDKTIYSQLFAPDSLQEVQVETFRYYHILQEGAREKSLLSILYSMSSLSVFLSLYFTPIQQQSCSSTECTAKQPNVPNQ